MKRFYLMMVRVERFYWKRVGNPYRTKRAAKSWLTFARDVVRGTDAYVETVEVERDENGNLTAEFIQRCSDLYNLDVTKGIE